MKQNEYCLTHGFDLEIDTPRSLKLVASVIREPRQAMESMMGRMGKALAKAGSAVKRKPVQQCFKTFLQAGYTQPNLAANVGERPSRFEGLRRTA